ncbi:MAG: glycosyltransferase [Paludibacteraceae bacterium]|nr:glycosyltransferase [Paludibacteraceae bacterium]MBQ6983998.1 glycosyltransferase [Paludibacteraceae bacterium]
MNLAPIIVFAYDRPEHLKRTIEALAKNIYAGDSELYIFCDGPKADANEERKSHVKQVREVAHASKGFKDIHVVEAAANKGLANSIIGGVSDVIAKHGRVIVLEDDLLTSPYFLKYMNTALDKYESYPSVFTISANRPPVNKMAIPTDYEYDMFVSLRPFSTGWATWKDRWGKIDWSLDYLDDFLKHPEQIKAFNRGGDDLTEMLCLQRDHKIDSWAIRYAFQHFCNHAVAILPCVPYVDNIGFDGTGIHSGTDETDFRNDVVAAPENPRMPDVVYEDRRIINAFANYYSKEKRPLWQKIINIIYRMLEKPVPFEIKKKIYA